MQCPNIQGRTFERKQGFAACQSNQVGYQHFGISDAIAQYEVNDRSFVDLGAGFDRTTFVMLFEEGVFCEIGLLGSLADLQPKRLEDRFRLTE